MNEINTEIASLLLQQGAKSPQILALPDTAEKVVVIPQGMDVKSLKPFCPPERIEQRVTLLEAGSFIDYVNRFKDTDTLIFSNVSETGVTFTAVLDYHQQKDFKPRYGRHVATFTAVETPDWKVWKGADRKPMKQIDFAEFLENNLQLFVSKETKDGKTSYKSNGATLLELVRTLHGHNNARFSTCIRLDNGAHSIAYEEDVRVVGNAGGTVAKPGQMELPPMVSVALSVFQGADPYYIQARLKSRIAERQLFIYFETVQMPAIVRESILLLVKQVAEKTKIVPLLGSV